MRKGACTNDLNGCAVCRVFRDRREQLRQLVISLTHEAYTEFWKPDNSVGIFYLSRWSMEFVRRLGDVLCHDTRENYQGLLDQVLTLRIFGVREKVIAASLGVMFLYVAVYTSAEVTTQLQPDKCVELIEHFGDLLTRLTLDVLPNHKDDRKSP